MDFRKHVRALALFLAAGVLLGGNALSYSSTIASDDSDSGDGAPVLAAQRSGHASFHVHIGDAALPQEAAILVPQLRAFAHALPLATQYRAPVSVPFARGPPA